MAREGSGRFTIDLQSAGACATILFKVREARLGVLAVHAGDVLD